MMPATRLLCAAALLFSSASGTLLAVSADGTPHCVLKEVAAGNKLSGSYEVIPPPGTPPLLAGRPNQWPAAAAAAAAAVAAASRARGLAVAAAVTGPAGEAHWSAAPQVAGSFTVLAAPAAGGGGIFQVCFTASGGGVREVAFSLHEGDELYREVAKKDHVTPLETEVTQLADAVAAIEDEQRVAWSRERALRDLDESTNSAVVRFSALEFVTFVVLGVAQALALVRFFERRTRF